MVNTFRAICTIQSEMSEEAASTYIVSMTQSAEDLLRVLLLGREVGLVDLAADPPQSAIDVVPLFETLEDLEQAPRIMRSIMVRITRRRYRAAASFTLRIMKPKAMSPRPRARARRS